MSEQWQDDEVGLKGCERDRTEIERQTDALVLKTVTSLVTAAEEVKARLRRDTDAILEDYRRSRRELENELSLAGADRQRMRHDAESESERILGDARLEAERIRHEAEAERESLLSEVRDMEQRLRALETQILDVLGATRGEAAPARSSESSASAGAAGAASSSAALGSLATGTTGVAADEPLTATVPVADLEPPIQTPVAPAWTLPSQSSSTTGPSPSSEFEPVSGASSGPTDLADTSTLISHAPSPSPIDADSSPGDPPPGSTLHATTGAQEDVDDEYSLIGTSDAASTSSSPPITHPSSTTSAATATGHANELGTDDDAGATSSSSSTVDQPESPTSLIDSAATDAPSSSSTSVGGSAVSSSPVGTPDGAASEGTDERRPLQLVFDGVPGYQQAAAIERAVGDLAEDGDVEIIEFEQGQLVLRVEASNPRSLADRLVAKPPLPMRLVASGRDSATFQLTPG